MSIDRSAFVDNIKDAFDLPDADMSLDTAFQELEQWDSLASVSTVAMVYEHYDVQISGDELVGCRTVGDILALVEGRRTESA